MKTILAMAASLSASMTAVAGPSAFTDAELADIDAAAAARTKAWQDYIGAYKPDYSDSSKYLEPPAENRFDEPFSIVRDGKAAAEIVLSNGEDYEPCLMQAALDLQKYLKLITGVELKINTGWAVLGNPKGNLNQIALGKRLIPSYRGTSWFASEPYNTMLKSMKGRDGYGISVNPGNKKILHVFGVTDKGTMNGVYALIENNTDLIWARPNEAVGTVYTPRMNNFSLVWGKDVISVPATPSRGWGGHAAAPWGAHNRCNLFNAGGGGDIAYLNKKKTAYGVFYTRHLGGHNIFHFLNGETDPTLFAHNDEGVRTGGNPCFTNPEMLRIFSGNVLNCARMAPENTKKLYINIQDTWNACICSNCLAPFKLADGTRLAKDDRAFRSTQYWMFMNKVTEALNSEYPDMQIVSLAYFATEPPPKCEINKNLHPEFAPYPRSNDKLPLTAPANLRWFMDLVGWSKLSRNIEMYDYFGLGMGFPRPQCETRAYDFAIMHPFVLGMCTETISGDDDKKPSGPMWDVSAMEFWVMSRLMWDPTQDIEKLRKYFIRRTFREAAPQVEKFYGTIREEWFKSPRASTIGDNPVELARVVIYNTGRIDYVTNLLNEAETVVIHPVAAENVRRLKTRMLAMIQEAAALNNPSMSVPLVRVTTEPDFESDCWNNAAKMDTLIKTTKERNLPSVNPTDVRVFHDSDNLHFRIVGSDPSIKDLAVTTMPDGKTEFIPEKDHVEIFLTDPLEEGKYYLFTLTPDNVHAELAGYDGSWNGAWSHKTRRTEAGWEMLVTIPLATINANNEKGNNLKLLLLRETHKHGSITNREYASWGGGFHHRVSTFGDIKLMR